MSDVITRDFLGQTIRVKGRNVGLATSLENLNEISLAINYQAVNATAAKVDVISSSAADTAAGAGARKVYLFGLDANFAFQSEEITMNGQTAVVSTKDFLRVFAAEVTTTGTGLVNAGDIYVYKTGTGGTIAAGVPGTLTSGWLKMLAGYGMGTSGLFTTPAGRSYQLRKATVGGRTQPCEVQLYSMRLDDAADTSLHLEEAWAFGNACMTYVDYDPTSGPIFPPKTDIYLRGLSSTAAGCATAELVLDWVQAR